ncbi:chaperone NapD [Sulfurivermis fontis]|jgi:nitrate reductase NapD|uniref:chaperone NapD n=1 Tax=Sulfurivermis fontis TaxID=1972068 RepID=UPI000FD8E6E4|nr:chaperone NapD [Sulfurivermis fontis]
MNEALSQDATAISVAGVLVHAAPAHIERVRAQLTQLPGVEVHAVTPEGKMVVTVEESAERMTGETVMRLYDVEGVLSAAMIYHQFENDVTEQEASQ